MSRLLPVRRNPPSGLAAALVVLACSAAGCIPGRLDLAPSDAAADVDTGKIDSGKPGDCHVECSDWCLGGPSSAACDKCVNTTCAPQLERSDKAPGSAAYYKCIQGCTTDPCWNSCCQANLQACDAEWLVSACVCGFFALGVCAQPCQGLCGGQLPTQDCTFCSMDTACGPALFDWQYSPTTPPYSQCMECDGGTGCQQACCSGNTASCQMLETVRKCMCTEN
ncbi:MAG: hypothetical protein HY898_32630 [Deltaproteobacteria bacterium]|nr:hypothetical protein [Deltaproteobacteria bacterium]